MLAPTEVLSQILTKHEAPNGGVDAAARIKAPLGAPS